MADFQPRLWLAEDPASAIDAGITPSDDCLVVSAAGQRPSGTGNALTLSTADGEFVNLTVEREKLMMHSDQPGCVLP